VFLAPYSTSDIKANRRVGTSVKRASMPSLEEIWLLGVGFALGDNVECIKGFYFTMCLCAILTLEREIARKPSLSYR
jgi:hypothetical protein